MGDFAGADFPGGKLSRRDFVEDPLHRLPIFLTMEA